MPYAERKSILEQQVRVMQAVTEAANEEAGTTSGNEENGEEC